MGTLKLIVGPMFSGKSTELLHNINSYRSIGNTVLVINHAFNKRYDSSGVSTHDNRCDEDCLTTLSLMALLNDVPSCKCVDDADVICIEELQFFDDALEAVLEMVNRKHKKVICAGLIGDYRCQPFGDIHKLIPHADEIQHVKALCAVCNDGTIGLFTQRVSPHTDQVAVGTKTMYRPVCRKHYLTCENDSCSNATQAEEDDYQVGYSYASGFNW